MKCPKCGMSLPDDSEFCQYCGSALSTASPPSQSGTGFDYQKAVSAYNRLSTEQKDRFFPGKESQAKKAIGSMVYLLGESSSIDVLYEAYLSIASRLQLGFSNERIQQTVMMRYSSIVAPEIAVTVINCIGKVSKNFGHLQKDRQQEDLSIYILFDAQYRQRFAENEKKKDDAITLAGFGVNPENPIYAHGTSSSYDYLNKLYSDDSIPLIWDRIGSTSTDLSEDLIDAYELCLPDGTHFNNVYINMYSKATSSYCPLGMSSFELMQLPSIKDPITKTDDGQTDESVDGAVPYPEGKIIDQRPTDNESKPITTNRSEVIDAAKAAKTDESTTETLNSTSNTSAEETSTQPISLISALKDNSATLRENKQSPASDSQETCSTSDVIYCNKCGQALPGDSEFCQYCGSRDLTVSEINIRGEKSEKATRSASQYTENKPNPSHGVTHDNAVTNPKTKTTVGQTAPIIPQKPEEMNPHSLPASSNEKDDHKQESKITEIDKSRPRQESSRQSVNYAFYCKRCGGIVDKISRKCSVCGKQYFRLKAILPVIIMSFIVLLLGGLNVFQYLNNQTIEMHRRELEQSISEKEAQTLEKEQTIADKDTYIVELEQSIKERDDTISSQNSTISSQRTKISDLNKQIEDLQDDYFDSLMENLHQLTKINFYEKHAVVVPDDGTNLYHTYGCDYLDTSSFWIYNTEAAISKGFKPCPHCQK